MREILFKAKRLGNGEWVEGFYVCCRKSHYILPIFNEDESFHGFDDRYDDWVEVDVSTLCQYTGLTDKNGKKIWENDIICNYYDDLFPEDETMSLIVWDIFGWKIKEGSSPVEISIATDIGNCEVVGNIFDNPELLQED